MSERTSVPTGRLDPTLSAEAASDSIELAEIREGEINVKVLSSGRKAIVLRRGDDISVFAELCPHMGADMSTATYCPSEGTLACSWHGYVFDAGNGTLRDNPNERLFKPLRGPSKHYRPEKFPAYRLRRVPFQVRGSTLYLGRHEET
jgi:nitrite reductase/ring-hydroxylating ferredoxin subunit